MNRTQEMEALEAMVDVATLGEVLRQLAEICQLKAQHILEAWQDRRTAAPWIRAAKAVELAAARVKV